LDGSELRENEADEHKRVPRSRISLVIGSRHSDKNLQIQWQDIQIDATDHQSATARKVAINDFVDFLLNDELTRF